MAGEPEDFVFAMDSKASLSAIFLKHLWGMALVFLGASCSSSDVTSSQTLKVNPRDFAQLATKRIFFGHQSVGFNLLDAVVRLGGPAAGLALREQAEPSRLEGPAWVHTRIGENGQPLRKIEHFKQWMDRGVGAWADIALLKFCYVDFDGRTNPESLFTTYRETMRDLKVRYPQTTFVHITAPLTTVANGFVPSLKHLLGWPVWGEIENVQRARFNALLRATYQGKEPIFDLAKMEATGAGGAEEGFDWHGERIPSLAKNSTADGGHLTPEAADRIAASFIHLLASLPAASTTQAAAAP